MLQIGEPEGGLLVSELIAIWLFFTFSFLFFFLIFFNIWQRFCNNRKEKQYFANVLPGGFTSMIAQSDFVMYIYWVKKLELASFLYGVFLGPLGQCIFRWRIRDKRSDHVTRNASAERNNEAQGVDKVRTTPNKNQHRLSRHVQD